MPPGGAEVDVAVLFADVRGSTALGERVATGEYADLLNRFYATATDVLLHEAATEHAFRGKPLGEYDVLHIASHGLLAEDLSGLTEPALVLTPVNAGDAADDGLLTASEIAHLSLNARLVVLSACNTAKLGLATATSGVQDLQTAFTVAGLYQRCGLSPAFLRASVATRISRRPAALLAPSNFSIQGS